MKMPHTLLASIAVVAIAATSPATFAASAAEAKDAIADAHATTKKVAKVGYQWRDTGKMIKKAEEAAAKGDNDAAVKLAREAEEQSKDAYAQYERYYESAGPRF